MFFFVSCNNDLFNKGYCISLPSKNPLLVRKSLMIFRYVLLVFFFQWYFSKKNFKEFLRDTARNVTLVMAAYFFKFDFDFFFFFFFDRETRCYGYGHFPLNCFNCNKAFIESNQYHPLVNPFVRNAPFLYPLKTSENCKLFWCFQGVA